MFFLNQDIKYIVLDLPSIGNIDACLSALESAVTKFEQLYVIDSRGREEINSIYGKTYSKLFSKVTVYPQKPEPYGWLEIPLREFLSQIKISSLDSLFISEDEQNLTSAQSFPFGTLAYSIIPTTEELAKLGTDFISHTWNDIGEILTGKFVGLWGEVCVSPVELRIKNTSDSVAQLLQVQNPRLKEVPIYYGGRYLSREDDSSGRHLYSQRLLSAKSRPELQGPQFTFTLNTLIDFIISTEKLNPIITYVPPKPSDARDRLGVFLHDISQKKKTITKALNCIKDYPKQRDAGSYALRAKNVQGAFVPTLDPKDKEFIIIDDIGTSFSTVNECARTLLRGGAKKVVILCIAITCEKSLIVLPKLQCKKCGKLFRINFNGKSGDPFWGCSGFPDCKRTATFAEGIKYLRKVDRAEISF